jgi:hypothetical protein
LYTGLISFSSLVLLLLLLLLLNSFKSRTLLWLLDIWINTKKINDGCINSIIYFFATHVVFAVARAFCSPVVYSLLVMIVTRILAFLL